MSEIDNKMPRIARYLKLLKPAEGKETVL